MQKRAFTLIELLVVIVILGILITLASRSLRTARIQAKKAQAMVEMKSIETAVMAYMNKYGKLPLDSALQGGSEPDFDESFSVQTIEILTGINSNMNTVGMVFLDPQGDGSVGVFRDPWGEQYRIALDTDYNGVIDDFFGEIVHRKVAVIAQGFYLLNNLDNTNDLVKSWR